MEKINTFNQEVERILNNDFPDSLENAVCMAAKRFNINIEEAVNLLGDSFKNKLMDDHFIDKDESFF